MLTKSTPSALPRRASASSVKVTTISSTPLMWRASEAFTQRGGAIFRLERSGLASRLNRITKVWPSRCETIFAPPAQWNSMREKSAACATRTSNAPRAATGGGAAYVDGASVPAMHAAATLERRSWRRVIGLP
jgi:hypothetical protein